MSVSAPRPYQPPNKVNRGIREDKYHTLAGDSGVPHTVRSKNKIKDDPKEVGQVRRRFSVVVPIST